MRLAPNPSSLSLSVQFASLGSPFDGYRVERVVPADKQESYENLTYCELRRLCSQLDYARKDSKAASETRLKSMDAIERVRACDMADATDTLDGSIEVCEKHSGVDALHLAFSLDKEVVKERAQRLD